IRIRLRYGYAWPQAGHAAEAELPQVHVGAVELIREDELGLVIEEAEALRQAADDCTRPGIDHQTLPNCRACAAKVRLPVSILQNHRPGAAVLAVLQRKEPAQLRPRA